VAIPADRNVVQKEAGKKLKYNSLCIEMHEMYDYTGNNWSTGIVTKVLKKYLKAIPGKRSKDSLKKKAVLGTAHIIWKTLQCEI